MRGFFVCAIRPPIEAVFLWVEFMKVAELMKQKAGQFDFDPHTKHHFSDHLYAKEMIIPKGAFVIQHQHNYSHFGLLAQGAVVVRVDGQEDKVYTAPACINIAAETNHGVIAMEDSVWFCIHQTDEKDESKIDNVLIKRGK